MSLLDEMPDRCTIRRRIRSKGTMGGSKASFTNDQTNVLCWEQQVSSGEVAEFEKKGITIDSKVYFVANPGVTGRHQILITSRSGAAVAGYPALDVVGDASPDASVGREFLWRVMCLLNRGKDD